MPCFLCNHTITPSEACGALEFAGDVLAERGRYAVHRECLRPEWRKRWVTREHLLHPETLSLVIPETDREQQKWLDEVRFAAPSPVRRALAQFFAWGSRQFAVEPLHPRQLGYNDDGSVRHSMANASQGTWHALRKALHWGGRRGASDDHVRTNPNYQCAAPGCAQSRGATGFCMQHQAYPGTSVTEPAMDEPSLPSVYTLTASEVAEAMHKHDRCCSYEEHFRCAEFVCLGQRYAEIGGEMSDLGLPWDTWHPDDYVDFQNTTFFVVDPDQQKWSA